MKPIEKMEKTREGAIGQTTGGKQDVRMRIAVGMATCGIAAGAKQVVDAFNEELKRRNINDVKTVLVGCRGACRLEPLVEITGENGEMVTYVNMTPEKVARVVAEHVVNGRICIDYTVGTEVE